MFSFVAMILTGVATQTLNREAGQVPAESQPTDPKKRQVERDCSNTNTTLDASRCASQIAPVPCVQTAASNPLSIVEQAQDERGIKGEYPQLAKDACNPVYVTLVVHEDQESERREMLDDVDTLEDLSETLDEYEREKARQFWMKRFIVSNSAIVKTGECGSWLQSKIHALVQPAHISAQRDAMPVCDHGSSQSDRVAPHRFGADNDRISDSFNDVIMGNNNPDIPVTGDVASGNTDLTHAFNNAQMGNISGPDVEQISGGASTDRTVYITIASDNSHLHEVFQGAVMGNISSPQSSVSIASGNKNMSRSFNNARIGDLI